LCAGGIDVISALERLRALRAGRLHPDPPAPREITVAELPPDWRLEFEERAAIREYDGGQLREHAEAEALREIVTRMRAAAIRAGGGD
jgi:hypothetical protein